MDVMEIEHVWNRTHSYPIGININSGEWSLHQLQALANSEELIVHDYRGPRVTSYIPETYILSDSQRQTLNE